MDEAHSKFHLGFSQSELASGFNGVRFKNHPSNIDINVAAISTEDDSHHY
jgi:hypothetical protein